MEDREAVLLLSAQRLGFSAGAPTRGVPLFVLQGESKMEEPQSGSSAKRAALRVLRRSAPVWGFCFLSLYTYTIFITVGQGCLPR